MIKILFICHGNICRSPMAEYVMKHMTERAGWGSEFFIDSAGTHSDALGSPVHPNTRRTLEREGIVCGGHRARLLTHQDYELFDLIVAMDTANLRNIRRQCKGDPEGKVRLLLDYVGRPGESVADPWYTGDFDTTFRDVWAGCEALLKQLKKR